MGMAHARQNFSQADSLWSWRHKILKSGLDPATRHVLLTLACWMNDTSAPCFSSVRNLVAATGLPTDTVRRCLREAVAAGWIEVLSAEPGYFQVTRLFPGASA